jgi:outer membrane protein TolC
VFGSLLSQRRFTEANFAISALNHPDAVTNTRTTVSVAQPVWDAGLSRLALRAATAGRDLAAAERDRTAQDLAVAAAQAYVRVLRTEAALRAAEAAAAAAETDLQRARARKEVGLVTDADALAVEVHLADVRQRQIAATGDLAVARVQLAQATGLPLTEQIVLVPPAAPPPAPAESLVGDALKGRLERREAQLREQLADTAARTARARFIPTLGVQAGWELNGSAFTNQESSWVVGAQLQWNVFRGFADTARLAEARHARARAGADRERVERAIEVDVRAAAARLAAARARQDAGRAALQQARESQRIVRDRYESGLATVTDVLRAAEAVLDAEARSTASELDVILEGVALDRATGRL